MNSVQLFAAMPPTLAIDVLEHAFVADKEVYRAALAAVAQARKVRPVFLERQPRVDRFRLMATALGRLGMETVAASLLTSWLVKKHSATLVDFLNAAGVTHDKGVVEDLPKTIDDATLNSAVETVLAKYPREVVALYLHAFQGLNDVHWTNLETLLQTDPRLKLSA